MVWLENYSSPRYKSKSRSGRKPLAEDERRKQISARVALETYNYLMEQNIKIGLLIDHLVRKEMLGLCPSKSGSDSLDEKQEKGGYEKLKNRLRETFNFDAPECLTNDPCDITMCCRSQPIRAMF